MATPFGARVLARTASADAGPEEVDERGGGFAAREVLVEPSGPSIENV